MKYDWKYKPGGIHVADPLTDIHLALLKAAQRAQC